MSTLNLYRFAAHGLCSDDGGNTQKITATISISVRGTKIVDGLLLRHRSIDCDQYHLSLQDKNGRFIVSFGETVSAISYSKTALILGKVDCAAINSQELRIS
jgi:hypothetical protein